MTKTLLKKYLLLLLIFIIALLLIVGMMIVSRPQTKTKKEIIPLKTLTIQPTKNHSASVIFLHGLGNNAENQRIICQPLAEKYPHIKFIIPQAPTISVSMNRGWSMPAWYNIKGNPSDIMNLKEDEKGLLKSVDQIKKIIQEEINSGISPKKIMVVGHSQGASMALAVGLTSDYPLAGIIGLSAFLPCRHEIFNWAKAENKITFFLYHNYYDDIVPAWVGSQSADLLKEKGYQVEFEERVCGGGHFFQSEELQEILTEKLNTLLS